MNRQPTAGQANLIASVDRKLGEYELLELLRASDTTNVHRGRQLTTGDLVVIKLLHAPHAHPLAVQRFDREINALQQLNHPGIVRFIDSARTPTGESYFVTEYLKGVTLEQLVRDSGPLSDGRTLLIMKQACEALKALHESGRVHRDIKPANIMLSSSDLLGEHPTIIDLGLSQGWPDSAKLSIPVELGVAGTPAYLSPEAAQPPNTIDHRSDIYSIGCVGYFLLSGHPPFTGHNPIEICWKHIYQLPLDLLAQVPHPSNTSQSLTTLIMRCLAKNPLERPQSADDLLGELSRIDPRSPWTDLHAKLWWEDHQ